MYLQIKRAFMALCLSLTCMITFAQREVTGSVTDPMGKPLIGVSVVVDGTSIGSVTDINGNFTISRVPNDATLRLSYIGYREQKLPLGSQSNYYITMHEDNQNLDELVVIGYQTVKKRDVTGAVSSLKAEDLQNVAVANGLVALQATIPGIDLTQNSGEAGSSIDIKIRGARSLAANNSPLIMVDGAEYGSTLDVNPADIESIDVLKDASSTAIYGTRGANGVILITTKRGQAGKTHVTFNTYNSWNSATAYPKTLYGDAEEKYRQERKDYATNYATYLNTGTWGTVVSTPEQILGTTALEDGTLCLDIYNNKSYTNWTDYFMQNSTSQNYVIGVNGGSERTNFAISLGLMDDRGLMENDELKRYNGKVNIDHKVNDYFKFGGSLLFTYKDQDKANSGIFNQYLKMTTITHPYLTYENGTTTLNYTPNPWYSSHCSPLLDKNGYYQHNFETSRFFGNVYAEINLIKGVSYRSQFAVDRQDIREGLYQDYQSVSRYQSPCTNYIANNKTSETDITWDNTLSYNTDFGGSRNNLNLLVGHEMIQNVGEVDKLSGEAGTTHYVKNSFYDTSKITSRDVDNKYTKTAMLSFFGRANYNFSEKYLFTASVRADGSSVLAKGHKWGYFPSFAAAWRITEEPWMLMASSWLSNLKFRLSWGLAGNTASEAYQTLAELSNDIYYYAGANKKITTSIAGKVPSSMANPDLTWEKTSTLDLGLDFGFANGRVNGTFDLYWSHTNDLLSYKMAPASSVFTSMLANVGKTKGFGIEFSLAADAIRSKDFDWNVNLTYTHSTDEVTELSKGVSSYATATDKKFIVKGERINTFYDYKADNTWSVGEYETYLAAWKTRHPGQTPTYAAHYGDPGTPKIVDTNDDGKISEADRIIYNMDPDHIFGLTNTFTYKGFSLSFQTYASIGGYIRYTLSDAMNFETANWADVDYWTVDNQHAKFPSPGLTSAQQTWYTTYKTALEYEKANYFKIKDITFGYNFPKKLISHLNMTNLRIYGSLKNYITISGIDNYDPERGGAVAFPLQKQVVVGLNVEF